MNKSLLLDLYNHELEVKVWASKTKLSARAKYDRPKAFRLPAASAKRSQSESEDGGTSEQTVRRPSKLPVVSHDKVRACRAGRPLKQTSSSNVQATPSALSLDSEASGGDLNQREFKGDASPIPEESSDKNLGQLAVPTTTGSNGAVGTTTSDKRGM